MGTMNVYIGGCAKLMAALAQEGALPRALAADAHLSVPRRPLALLGAAGVLFLVGLLAGVSTTDDLVRATSACFIAVYALALLSAARILTGRVRSAAGVTFVLVLVVAAFSSWFLAVPAIAAVAALALRGVLDREPRFAGEEDAVDLQAVVQHHDVGGQADVDPA
jgi:amino acid transporter